MSLDDFAQSLNLDQETKLRAQRILSTKTEYDESLWTPAVVYFCCQNGQVATLCEYINLFYIIIYLKMNLVKATHCWIEIFSYLTDKDIYNCDHVCQYFRNILSTSTQMVKKLFETYNNYGQYHYLWFLERIKLLKIEKLRVFDYPYKLNGTYQFLVESEVNNLVEDLDLKSLELTTSEIRTQTLEKLLHLEELILNSTQIEDEQFKYIKNIKHLSIKSQFEEMVINQGFKYLTNLVSLKLFNVEISFHSFIGVLEKNYNTLQNLKFEAERYDKPQILQIFRRLNPQILKSLKMCRFEDCDNQHIDALVQFKNLNNMYFLLVHKVDTQNFVRFLEFKSLIEVTFTVCKSFNDQCLDTLVQYSPQLEKIDIAFTKCTSLPVQRLLLQCGKLKSVNLARMDMLTNDFLPHESTWDRILKYCKHFNLCDCPQISTNLIEQFKSRKQHIGLFYQH